jgi:hypothetical protein
MRMLSLRAAALCLELLAGRVHYSFDQRVMVLMWGHPMGSSSTASAADAARHCACTLSWYPFFFQQGPMRGHSCLCPTGRCAHRHALAAC